MIKKYKKFKNFNFSFYKIKRYLINLKFIKAKFNILKLFINYINGIKFT